MELTVLGADGTWPRRGGAASGFLLRHDGYAVWQDMGTGTMANLQRHVDLLEVDAVVISHVHADHFVDLFPYFYARRYGGPEPAPRIPLHVPTGTEDRIRAMLSGSGWEEFPRSFEVRELAPGEGFEAGPFRVATERMAHPVPTMGTRYEADGAALAYSADTGPCDELGRLARGADLLIAEATWLEDGAERPAALHMTAKEAGDHASRAGVGRLVLTHIQPTMDLEASRQEAARGFDGPIEVATAGKRWGPGR